MVIAERFRQPCGPRNAIGRIVLQPNRSMSWRAAKWFIAGLCVLSMSVATMFLVRGYWMILPFSVIELGIVAACFYLILRRNAQQQVIQLSRDSIVVESGRCQVERSVAWQRYFTQVLVSAPRHPWHAVSIKLRCRSQELEIGWFLSTAEKHELVRALGELIRVADREADRPSLQGAETS